MKNWQEIVALARRLVDSGRSYAKRGLLYEAAYFYGQAVMVVNTLYLLHDEELVHLPSAMQSFLAQIHETLAINSLSLQKAAGNGHRRHRMGATDSGAAEDLQRVIEFLKNDLEAPPWSS